MLDLSGLRFIDSMGDSELIMTRHEATSSGQGLRVVAGANRRLRQLVELVGPFPIYDSVDDACPTRAAVARSLDAERPDDPPDAVYRLGA